jgi:outer membrane protein TolC
MKKRSFTSSEAKSFFGALGVALLLFFAFTAHAQEAPLVPTSASAISLTLKRAIELALQNSKDIQIAKLQASLANRSAMITKAQFMPNLYAGSGAGYTLGIPETPGGRAPALFNVTYTEEVLNEPLRGQGKEQQEQAKSQKILLEDARNNVIVRTASTFLELAMVRHSLELLRKEQESADKILAVTLQREKENFELPVAHKSARGAAHFAARRARG